MSKFVKQIKERLEEEGGAAEAIELNLSQLNLSAIDKESKVILENAKNVEVLVINQNQLTSLESLPNWKLKSLSITENKLTDSSLLKLNKYPQLVELILTENDIKTLEGLTPIFSLKSLQILDLSQNPVAQKEGYSQLIWEKMPFLKVLDFFDREGNEIQQQFEDDDDEDDDGEVISDDQSEDDEDEDGEGSNQQEQKEAENNNNK